MNRLLPLVFALAMAAPAVAAPPLVVADTPVTGGLVAQVMGDLGTPEVLLPPGADAHHFQMRPSQAMALARADLLFWVGPDLTPWLERAANGVGGRAVSVPLLSAEGMRLRHYDEGPDADHGHDHGHDHSHGHGHGHGHGGEPDRRDDVDPHAWLDPHNVAVWLEVIAARLAGADPDNAATYAANAAHARARLSALDARVAAALRPLRGVPMVVSHDAYGYFAERYGLEVAGAVAHGDASAPGAARLAALRETIGRRGVRCIFPEAGDNPALARVVAEGTGARIGEPLDPAGRDHPAGPDQYERLMLDLTAKVRACLAQE